ncbi:MAG: bifunctional diaminohydroxyphosphoribosylaminopyrimidine deaminase/5-amino-6-(5-phosphoribosylamino)uracil reductase RibD [Micrococcales bacterium]|nr:bifunctional diaminohydroxyphosphoribosylaminopyrimidine deaminase/5-amino-6-(5-phosphoribosylamino)uracil reductase RibD [Micrococcales bacterium]
MSDDTSLAWVKDERIFLMLALAMQWASECNAQGPNPRVGCLLLTKDGLVAGGGVHRGAGHHHAEVEALKDAVRNGRSVAGGTAIVTLEPCAHTGRTGPCTQALIDAGIDRVAFAISDPSPQGGGGAEALREAGIEVAADIDPKAGRELNRAWFHSVSSGRPYVTLKTATTLDGRIAAADGTSQWITSPEARAHAHEIRANVDAILVGTGTALADDPALTARLQDGRLAEHQPLRVVMGLRELPAEARLRGEGGELVIVRSRDPGEVLEVLAQREVRHVLIEGGASVATAFVRAGLVDEVHAYVEPMVLGAGRSVVEDVGVATLAKAPRWGTHEVKALGSTAFVAARLKEG